MWWIFIKWLKHLKEINAASWWSIVLIEYVIHCEVWDFRSMKNKMKAEQEELCSCSCVWRHFWIQILSYGYFRMAFQSKSLDDVKSRHEGRPDGRWRRAPRRRLAPRPVPNDWKVQREQSQQEQDALCWLTSPWKYLRVIKQLKPRGIFTHSRRPRSLSWERGLSFIIPTQCDPRESLRFKEIKLFVDFWVTGAWTCDEYFRKQHRIYCKCDAIRRQITQQILWAVLPDTRLCLCETKVPFTHSPWGPVNTVFNISVLTCFIEQLVK